MERKDSQSIGDILRLALQQNCMAGRLDELKAIDLWEGTVGKYIASQCRRPTVDNGVMTVGVANASLRNELAMNRSALRNSINKALGKSVISEIRFIS